MTGKVLMVCLLFAHLAWGRSAAQEVQGALDPNSILQAARSYVLEKSGIPEQDLIMECKSQLTRITIPSGQINVIVSSSPREDFSGFTPLEIKVLCDGKPVSVQVLTFEVDALTDAFMTRDWVKRHDPLTPDNITSVRIARSKLPLDAVTDQTQLQGQVAKTSLAKGKVLARSLLDEPAYVKSRGLVGIVIDQGGLRITTRGLAMNDGLKGEIIRVKPLDSKREIYAKVIGHDLVSLDMTD